MKKTLLMVLAAMFLGPFFASAQTAFITKNLKLGDRGVDVLILQQILNKDPETRIALMGIGSPGQESDYFGSLTRSAVMKFQQKYRTEVLYPAGLFAPTGFVGSMTRAKLATIASGQVFPPVSQATTSTQTTKPTVTSVSPSKVRPGEMVTVIGENFTKTGNKVTLAEGYASREFSDLTSSDGKTITFMYKAPLVEMMSESQIRALPADAGKKIEEAVTVAGSTLNDVANPFKDIQSEAEFLAIVEKKGFSEDSIYHRLWVTVDNSNGTSHSKLAILQGLRKFPFDHISEDNVSRLISGVRRGVGDFLGTLIPTANAQIGGGFTTGIVYICMCGGTQLTFQIDFLGAGTGFYGFPIGFVPMAGSGRAAGPWLGAYITGGGQCYIYVPPFECIYFYSNSPALPLGYGF